MFPQLGSLITPVNDDEPETTLLQLPSSFTLDQREFYKITEAADVELQLRRGGAFDTLSELRDTIHEFNSAIIEKRANSGSQNVAMRAQNQLANIKSRMVVVMNKYMSFFTALISLGCQTSKEGLYPLDESQLWGKNIFLPHAIGDSSRENPWFWSVGKPAELSDASWLIERKFIIYTYYILTPPTPSRACAVVP